MSDRFYIGPPLDEMQWWDECGTSPQELWDKIVAAERAHAGPILFYGGPYKLTVAQRSDAAEFCRIAEKNKHPRLGDPSDYWTIRQHGHPMLLEHPSPDELAAWVRGDA